MKIKRIISSLLLVAAIQACGGDDNWRDRQGLDPDTEAEVSRINLERYAGNWFLKTDNGGFYLSISEQGFYWTQQDKQQHVLGGDFGHIVHALPGTMILRSNRPECDTYHVDQYLHMDRTLDGVALRSESNAGLSAKLTAVDEQERIIDLRCGEFKR